MSGWHSWPAGLHCPPSAGTLADASPPPTLLAAPQSYNYTSDYNGNTYILNTRQLTQSQAQQSCNAAGGHLAAWVSNDEQADVEGYFAAQVSQPASDARRPPAESRLKRSP